MIAWLQIWWMRPQSYVYYSVIKNTLWTAHRISLHYHPNKRQTFSHNCTGVQKMVSECVQQTGVNCGLSRTVPAITSALMTHQAPTLKSCSGTLWSSMELCESLQILWDETSCASSLNRMCVAYISVLCTPLRYQHIGFYHLTIVMEFVVNHIMCA
jgi:hypothetical protein